MSGTIADRVLLDPGVLSHVLSFLPRQCVLDPVCKSIRDVMHEVGRYAVEFSEKSINIANSRVKRPDLQLRVEYYLNDLNRPGEVPVACLHDVSAYNEVKIHICNSDGLDRLDLAPLANNTVGLFLNRAPRVLPELSLLKNFKKLQQLRLSHSNAMNISWLAELTELKLLDISYSPVSDLTPLEGLKHLEDLDFDCTRVECIAPLRYLVRLRNLEFRHITVSSIDSLQHLQLLSTLHFNLLNVADWSVLPKLRSLRELALELTSFSPERFYRRDIDTNEPWAAVHKLPFLANMKQLIRLSVTEDSAPIICINSLREVTHLRVLDIANTHIADITPLSEMHELEEFFADMTRISDVSVLGGLASLRKLGLERTRVTDVSCLERCSLLRVLCINRDVRGYQNLISRGVYVDRNY